MGFIGEGESHRDPPPGRRRILRIKNRNLQTATPSPVISTPNPTEPYVNCICSGCENYSCQQGCESNSECVWVNGGCQKSKNVVFTAPSPPSVTGTIQGTNSPTVATYAPTNTMAPTTSQTCKIQTSSPVITISPTTPYPTAPTTMIPTLSPTTAQPTTEQPTKSTSKPTLTPTTSPVSPTSDSTILGTNDASLQQGSPGVAAGAAVGSFIGLAGLAGMGLILARKYRGNTSNDGTENRSTQRTNYKGNNPFVEQLSPDVNNPLYETE